MVRQGNRVRTITDCRTCNYKTDKSQIKIKKALTQILSNLIELIQKILKNKLPAPEVRVEVTVMYVIKVTDLFHSEGRKIILLKNS